MFLLVVKRLANQQFKGKNYYSFQTAANLSISQNIFKIAPSKKRYISKKSSFKKFISKKFSKKLLPQKIHFQILFFKKNASSTNYISNFFLKKLLSQKIHFKNMLPQKIHLKKVFKKIVPTKNTFQKLFLKNLLRENFLSISKKVSYTFPYKKQSFSN